MHICFIFLVSSILIGPKPIANSFTFTLHNLATMKWPPSCINIRKPNKNIIFIAVNKKSINILSFSYYKILSNKYANGAINITLSNLSSIPPCPGIKLLKSFIPLYLFILDAAKSPI